MLTEVYTRTVFPYSAVALLVVTYPDGTAAAGTGTIVGVNDILTATHVLFSPDHGGWASKLSIYPGADFSGVTGILEDAPYVIDQSKWQAKGWPTEAFSNGSNTTFTWYESQYDVAIIGTSTPIGAQTGWFNIAADYDSPQTGLVLGYSVGMTGMMSGSTWIMRDPSASLYLALGSAPSDLLGAGSSGGPLYVTGQDGQRYVIGVKSAATSTSNVWADVGMLYENLLAELDRNDELLGTTYLHRRVPDQDATAGRKFSFTLPSDTFKSRATPNALAYGAKCTDGEALPAWLNFDDKTASFSGITPAPGAADLSVRVTATDTIGVRISDDFLIHVGVAGIDFRGTVSADVIRAGLGNDFIDGGEGIDLVIYDGPQSEYIISSVGAELTVKSQVSGRGTDTLANVERLKFSDTLLAFDTAGNAGQAYRLYQSAFNRTPDKGGLGYQMNALDAGLTLAQVAQNFIDSPEFVKTYGSLNDAQFVTRLYQNVLHRNPDDGGLSYHVGNLGTGMSRAQVLVGFSESPENRAALIGAIQNGIEYLHA